MISKISSDHWKNYFRLSFTMIQNDNIAIKEDILLIYIHINRLHDYLRIGIEAN